ncbi:MAG TPA: DPP IV N-terminal domain-containing protein, partial [Nitrolancea sp.]|nr:DPP IV N-terminal domain-containing protein [Nitrolancea sp.]
LDSYACTNQGPVEPERKDEVLSPDKQWAALLRDGNLYVRDTAGGAERALTGDAEPFYDYATLPESRLSAVTDRATGKPLPPVVAWSPDSSRLFTYRLDQRQVEPIVLVQSVPPAGSHRPVAHPYRYPLPGDAALATGELLILDLQGNRVPLQTAPIHAGGRGIFETGYAWWGADGQHVYFVRAERGGQGVTLEAADASSGETRTLLEERGASTVFPQHVGMEITNVKVLDGDAAFTWFSAKSGWGHLYLHDAGSGEERNPITFGAWTVRDIVRVDETDRRIYFTAGGREPGRDPYYRHLYRARLDGSQLELLTPEDAEHSVSFSPSGDYFVDTFSRIDQPPVTVLRAADGRLVAQLEEADVSALLARGWRFPERFSVKARDGVTDIYGSIIRPTTYDSSHRYPMLDAIYPGPQTIRTPKAFPAANTQFWQDQALAELGFIVVTIDGMGTPYRSKQFHDVAYGAAFGEAGGLTDHVVGIKQLAARDASMDLDRVGIYGHSGGGYASTRALLLFPEFYRAAVSSAGNHDQLGYNASWGERWIGPYDAERYATQDNITLADRLEGKLLLVHGELDDNVHPSLTLRLVDALIAAGKDFEMLIIPNTNHGFFDTRRGLEAQEKHLSQGHPYFVRKRWDHFVRSLLGAEPPAGYRITPPG